VLSYHSERSARYAKCVDVGQLLKGVITMTAIINVSKSQYLVLDEDGNIEKNDILTSIEISAIISAYIKEKYNFVNIKYTDSIVKAAAKQLANWNNGEEAFIVTPPTAGGIGGNVGR
jgi:hypothetical protein